MAVMSSMKSGAEGRPFHLALQEAVQAAQPRFGRPRHRAYETDREHSRRMQGISTRTLTEGEAADHVWTDAHSAFPRKGIRGPSFLERGRSVVLEEQCGIRRTRRNAMTGRSLLLAYQEFVPTEESLANTMATCTQTRAKEEIDQDLSAVLLGTATIGQGESSDIELHGEMLSVPR